LVGRRDDRLDVAVVHAPDDELEQVPQVAAPHLRAGRLVTRVAPLELGDCFVDDSVLGAGKDC